MNDLLVQAEALKKLIVSVCDAGKTREVGERAIACSKALLYQGEAECALELLEAAGRLADDLGPSFELRLRLMKAQGLFIREDHAGCLEHCRESLGCPLEVAEDWPLAAMTFRAYEGASLFRLHRVDEATGLLEALHIRLLGMPDTSTHALVTVNLGAAAFAAGDTERAIALTTEALVSARRVRDDYWEGIALRHLASLHKHKTQWAMAEDLVLASIKKFESLSNLYWLADGYLLLAIVQRKRGRLTRALDSCMAQMRMAAQSGSALFECLGKELSAQVLLELGRPDDARAVLVNLQVGAASERKDLLAIEFLGDTYLETGSADEAMSHYERAWSVAMAIVPRGDIVAELRRRRAECYLLLAKPERALHEADEAIVHCVEIGDRYEESATYRIRALALAALGRHDEAREAFDKGFSCYDDIETPYEWGKLWMSYGDWICGDNAGAYRDLNGAHEAYRSAATYFESIGAALRLSQAQARITALEELMRKEGALPDLRLTAKPKPPRRPREIADLHRRGEWVLENFGLITRNKALIDLLEEVGRVAASDMPVLVLGESGTGKELVAQGIHKLSGRRGRFVAINASAVPASLVEGELFGHLQGSFTNAVRDREGLFEYSHNGTVFLDEIGEMSVELQAKLLRALELGEIRRVGGSASTIVDARIVAATNRDRQQMESGEGFRVDLYYRLGHALFELPPLRQRVDDIEFLSEYFLQKFCERYNKRVTISSEAMNRILEHPWPGNVRQLSATMQRLVVSARVVHTILPREVPLPERGRMLGTPASLEEELLLKERQRIVEALEKAQWVKADAARLLRMSRTTLITKMKRLGIEG